MPVTRESGFALPVVLSIMATIGLLVLATVGFATHSTDRANGDRAAVRAIAAADAGLDAAIYRMNKALFASQVQGLLGLNITSELVATARCVDLSLGEVQLLSPGSNGWCPASQESEDLDGPVSAAETAGPTRYSYTVQNGVNLGTSPTNSSASLIERKIVSTGWDGDVQKRVLGTVRLELGNAGNLLSVFQQVGYKQCTSVPADPANPLSGCT